MRKPVIYLFYSFIYHLYECTLDILDFWHMQMLENGLLHSSAFLTVYLSQTMSFKKTPIWLKPTMDSLNVDPLA